MTTHTLKPGISVLICTYNGARNLPATLRHLGAQRVDGAIPWEIILVNNASTDDTAAVAGRLLAGLPGTIPFRLVEEPRPGKDRAVDKGLSLAQYQYVLICDDDNWLAEDYVQRAYEVMVAHPQIGMLGGRGIPAFESAPPAWFEKVQSFYAVGRQHPTSGEVVTGKGFLWGAGAVVNLAAYRRLVAAGFERIITFANYPAIARGEDVELCMAIKLAGYQIWYDEGLALQHYIAADKLGWAYLTRLVREGSRMSPIIGIYKSALRQRSMGAGRPVRHVWLRKLLKGVLHPRMLPLWWQVKTGNREGSQTYLRHLGALYQAVSYAHYQSRYDEYVKQVARLKGRLQPDGA